MFLTTLATAVLIHDHFNCYAAADQVEKYQNYIYNQLLVNWIAKVKFEDGIETFKILKIVFQQVRDFCLLKVS